MTIDSRVEPIPGIVRESPVSMLTTFDLQGQLVGRPMLALLLDADPAIYFLTGTTSEKVSQVDARPEVGLTFGARTRYLSIRGRAQALHDTSLVKRLWNPTYRAWFPKGPGDGGVSVLRVLIDTADYWEAPTGRVIRLIAALKATVTGTPAESTRTTVKPPE